MLKYNLRINIHDEAGMRTLFSGFTYSEDELNEIETVELGVAELEIIITDPVEITEEQFESEL